MWTTRGREQIGKDGLGGLLTRADVVLEAVPASGDREGPGAQSATANVGHLVGNLITREAHMTGNPTEKDGLMARGIGLFELKDVGNQVLEIDREGDTIKQVGYELGVTKNVHRGAIRPGVQQIGDRHANGPEFREVVGSTFVGYAKRAV